MRHLEPCDHHANPGRLESRHLRLSDCLPGCEEVVEQHPIQVDPVVDLGPRDD
jgi:hypothetical protein